MGVALQNSTLPCAIATFPVSLPLLSSPGDVWPRLPLLSSLHATMNLRPPSVTASTQTSAFNAAIVFQSPVMPNARMSLYTQIVGPLFLLPTPSSPNCALKVSEHDSLWQPPVMKGIFKYRYRRCSRRDPGKLSNNYFYTYLTKDQHPPSNLFVYSTTQ